MQHITTHFRILGVALVVSGALACSHGMSVGLVYTERRPPPDRVEVMAAAPGADYVWIRGHWAWDRNDFGWVSGRWELVQRGYHSWVPGHWVERRHRWQWVEGHWAR